MMDDLHAHGGDTADIDTLLRGFPRPVPSPRLRGRVLEAARAARPAPFLRRLLPVGVGLLLLVLDVSFSRFQDRQLASGLGLTPRTTTAQAPPLARYPQAADANGLEAPEHFRSLATLPAHMRQRLNAYRNLRAELLADTNGG